MKNLLLTAAATITLVAVAAPASADNFAYWNVLRLKATFILETDFIDKDITVTVTDTTPLDSEASALIIVNSVITDDHVGVADVEDPGLDAGTQTLKGPFLGDPNNYDIRRYAVIGGERQDDGSITPNGAVNGNVGIGQLNQDVGNNSNQGNVVAAALVFGGNDLVKSEAYVEQHNSDNSSRWIESFEGLPTVSGDPASASDPTDLLPIAAAYIEASIDGNTGVFMVNQNAGNMNAQNNALGLAVGDNAFTALADAGLNQVNADNTTFDDNTVKADWIHDSVNGNTGVVAVNQSVGSMNNQATVINIAALTSAVDFH